MNAPSHLQPRPILSPAVARIALLVSAILLPLASLAPAAPIDQSYEYDALNRLASAGATTYQHDAAGNLVQMTTPVTPNLFATPSTRIVTYTANSATTVSLTANVSWTASSNQTWLTVSPASGTTGTTLTLTATTQTPTTSTRSATVTITGGSLTAQVTVTQDGTPVVVGAPTKPTNPSPTNGSVGVPLNPTLGWTPGADTVGYSLVITMDDPNFSGPVGFYSANIGPLNPNSFAPPVTFLANRTYHWILTPSNSEGQTAAADTWTFTTTAGTTDDHGGSIATATPIPTNASSATGVLTTSDEDFFRVTTPGPGILIVWTEGDTDTYAHLYNSAEIQLDEDNDSNIGANFRVTAAVTAGNYYVRLRSNTAATGSYTFHSRFIPSTEPIQVTYLDKASDDVDLGFTAVAGVLYYVCGSDDLQDWSLITTLTGTGAENYVTLAGQGAQPKRFFRVSTEPPVPVDFAKIPAGAFTMGDSLGEGYSGERPTHGVTLSAFYMSKQKVTLALWRQVRDWGLLNGYSDLPAGSGKADNHPVHSISWYDMVKWCNARSQMENLTCCYYTDSTKTTSSVYKNGTAEIDNTMVNWTSNGYRLPTEAEWEKAARGGLVGKRFPWGDTITHVQANYGSDASYSYDISLTRGSHPTYATGIQPYTSPVDTFTANGYGLKDMAGNVWDSCWDWYADYSTTPVTDPLGSVSGLYRVARGGVWYNNAHACRVSYRATSNPGDVSIGVGFRLARSLVLPNFDY